jgi:hypothetical protein
MDKRTCLRLLAQLEERRHKYGFKPSESDFSYRAAQALIAEACGYKNRNDWTDELKVNGYKVYL